MRRLRPASMAILAGPLLGLLLISAPAPAQQSDGFLFGPPEGSLRLHGGYSAPGTGSEIFRFIRERLTVADGAFRSFALGGQLFARVSERLDAGLDVTGAGSETASQFREWVDQDDSPIRQTTSLSRLSATLNVRFHPLGRGRSIGRYVWIPRRISPYLGAGGGLLWYGFEQEGEFVDFETLEIFHDRFVSEGQAVYWHLFGGLQVSLDSRFFVVGELRHGWGSAGMGEDFEGFDPIDLSGFQGLVGLAVRL